jgi:hypothetical protein
MKKINKNIKQNSGEMPEHYDLDYSRAKPNRFAPILAEQENYVKLEPDVKKVFKTSDEVNKVLRAIISAYPSKKRKSASPV